VVDDFISRNLNLYYMEFCSEEGYFKGKKGKVEYGKECGKED
jgi:hypothetical protein